MRRRGRVRPMGPGWPRVVAVAADGRDGPPRGTVEPTARIVRVGPIASARPMRCRLGVDA